MNKNQVNAKSIVKRHFEKFIKSTKIQGMQFEITDVLSVTPKTDKSELARKFSENFAFLRLDEHWRPVELKKFEVTPSTSKEAIDGALPLLKGAKFFVSLTVRYMGRSESLYAIVKKNAKPGDATKIIDPITGCFLVLSETTEKRNTDSVTIRFHNAFIDPCCEFTAWVQAICDGAKLRTCRGEATYKNYGGPFYHGAVEKSPIRQENNCCVMDYAFDLEYGLSGVTITYSNGNFTISAGHFSVTVLDKQGTLADCCPLPARTARTGASSGPERKTCMNTYPKMLDCIDDLDGFKYDSFEKLKKAVEKAAGETIVRVEEKEQDERGPCPGAGKHYDFYGKSGKYHGSGFSCECCEDDPDIGPVKKTKYKYNG